ncbi:MULTISPECIES: siderophore-iron reductase FhuF [unclassified Bosea (in: a-proteobacteria)]|uniref:siderophore-iron reductase FhuF n=1 Tax=unclassified Bosea (in: a-proteobacteria) TaxID=2653178 RepID=UPI000F75F901|nr:MULTISPECIES: siderophore-iron reductase FhuF [unclassified Bosea (in: a-proteobacteria)]AZO76742.1 siderophore-iron reductase FhuF [Bosea sp. Tri-49]
MSEARPLPSFVSRFPEALAWYRDKLVLPGGAAEVVSGQNLLAGAADGLMARFAVLYPDSDRRALVSMWTQWHFGALIIPATVVILLCDRDLPLELDQIAIVPQDVGLTSAIAIPDEGGRRVDGSDPFARLFEGHVAPLISHLAGQFRVSPRLLWANAAAIFEWTLQQLPAELADAQALAAARLRLERPLEPDGRRNPMFEAVRYPVEQGEPIRRRKLCCLRHLLAGVADCGSLCPLHAGCTLATSDAA